mmetsp:Transcript_60197/g.135473  ORF Transcript_60197/g.135473 Transcript_60197/m.135473 type:complete len:304 (+) Transcript_60197:47-958(+)
MATQGRSDGALAFVPDLRSQIEAVLVEQAKQSATQISTILSKALQEQSTRGHASSRTSPRRLSAPSADRTPAWTKGFYDPAQSTTEAMDGELPTYSTESIIAGVTATGKVDYRTILFDAMKMRDKCHSIMVEAKEVEAAARIARPVPMRREVSGEEQATAILRSASSIFARRRERGVDSQAIAEDEPQCDAAKEQQADVPGPPPTSAPSAPPTETLNDEDRQARQVVEVLSSTGVLPPAKPKPSVAHERWEHATRMAERNASLQRTLNELMADLERAKVIRETTSSSLSPPRQRGTNNEGVLA